FSSTINAFVLRGALPVFVDIRADTLNMDERQVEEAITDRTRAIVPVHYAGVACEMDILVDIARRHDVAIVEDNAHGLFGRYRGQDLGTFGALATLSFHETKNLSCGEGGALLINDPQLIAQAEIIREKGTNRSRFFRGEVDKYTWVDVGSSYLLSDMLAAFLWAQVESSTQIQARRLRIWNRYAEELRVWANQHDVRMPMVPRHCDHPAHLFYMLLPSQAHREAFIAYLREFGIVSTFHYQPLHLSEAASRLTARSLACPVTERI